MRRILVSFFALAILAAGCGDEDPAPAAQISASDDGTTDLEPASDPTTTLPAVVEIPTTFTTTLAPAPTTTAEELAEVGPYPVGITTRTLESGELVEIWYPAGDDATGLTDAYTVRDFTPTIMRDLVPEEINDRLEIAAGRDATTATDGPFPLVMFSHGSTSFRLQSSRLAHHLASWGMVVSSTDHPSRALINMLASPEDARSSVDNVFAMRALVLADETFGPIIDESRVGMSGHSAGGGTTLAVASAGDIAGYVSYASGAFSDEPLPDVPSLFMAGEIDTIVEPGRTADAFSAAPAPSWYLEFADSGHLAFSDLCAVGDGDATLIDLADAAGLSDFLNDGIRRLGTDGCEDPNRPVKEVWPGIHQATTGFFRFVFGTDESPVGLDESVTTNVTIQSK